MRPAKPNASTLPPESRQESSASTPIGEAFGDYELVGEIARGGMGVVYRAWQRSLRRTVALKMILEGRLASEDAVQRFHQEARAAAGLDHPNIVPVYEVGQHDGRHYFTMALVEGVSLAATVRNDGLPSIEDAAALGLGIAEAVAHAHAQGIIHRDLKPDNVLLDRGGRPRVTDFGLARSLTTESGLTASGQIMGTPSYMAPEQATGETRLLGPATDVYALGGVLYFLFTGGPPFTGNNVMQILQRVLHEAPESPRRLNSDLPPELEAVCLKCLEKDPDCRYASAAEVAAALRPFAAGAGAGLRPALAGDPRTEKVTADGTHPDDPPTAPRRPWLRIGLAVAGLALLAVGAFLVFERVGKPAAKPAGEASEADGGPAGSTGAVLIPRVTHHDFGLKVQMLGANRGEGEELRLTQGQTLGFRVEVARDAYVGVWNIAPDGTILQIFPNEYEPDNHVRAGKPRTVPGVTDNDEYVMRAGFTGGTERVWVVASTRPWKTPPGDREGPYVIFRMLKQKRDILIEPVSRGLIAEELLAYRVMPR